MSLFDYSIIQVHFIYFLISFHLTFYISYKIQIMLIIIIIIIIIIVFWLGRDKPSGFFFMPALLLSILTSIFLPSFFYILFHSCYSHARVFGKTLVHEFHISSHTEWYLFFSNSATTSAQWESGAIF